MKLSYIHQPPPNDTRGERARRIEQLQWADALGFDLAYLPKARPDLIAEVECASIDRLKIGLDASAFGPLSPTDMKTSVRCVNERLDGRLQLGVEMCCDTASMQRRMEAQYYETLFSRDPRPERHPPSAQFPMKRPCPEIIGLPVTGSAADSALAAERGYCPLTPSWQSPDDAARHWPAIVSGATSAFRRADLSRWHLARLIVIEDDSAKLDDYVHSTNSPIRAYLTPLAKAGVIGPDIDAHLQDVVIAGGSAEVGEGLLSLRETVGEFGTLHFVDTALGDPAVTRNTMARLANDVLPMIKTHQTNASKELEET